MNKPVFDLCADLEATEVLMSDILNVLHLLFDQLEQMQDTLKKAAPTKEEFLRHDFEIMKSLMFISTRDLSNTLNDFRHTIDRGYSIAQPETHTGTI